jgi:7,8-dihydro-6-hydroxymethylpterin-pyrophosphokinase
VIKHIQNAVGLLPQVAELSGTEDEGSVKVKRVSRLYESRPMYVLDQGEFINGVIEVSRSLAIEEDKTLISPDW